MDSPSLPDTPPSPYFQDPVVHTLPKARGRPRGSRGRSGPGTASGITKSSPINDSRSSPDQRPTRYPTRAVSDGAGGTLGLVQESPSRLRRRQPEDSVARLVELVGGDLTDDDDEQPPAASDDKSMPVLGRSSASVPILPQTPRPTPTRENKSEPARIKETPSAFQLDSMIAAAMRKPLPRKQSQGQEWGNNYACEVVTASNGSQKIVKIGCTKGLENDRFSQIIAECKHQKIDHQEDPEHLPIRLYEKAEKLAHEELSAFKYTFNCNCKTKHREYFAVKAQIARDVVRRWRDFCKQEPYDSNGNLRAFWEHRLRKMRRGGASETIHHHEERAKRWDQILKPTDSEKILFEITQGFYKIWTWRWQCIALFEGWMIVLLGFPSFRAMLCFLGVVLWVIAELLEFELPLTLQVIKENFDSFQSVSRSSAANYSGTGKHNADPPREELQNSQKRGQEEDVAGMNESDDEDSALVDLDESVYEEDSERSVLPHDIPLGVRG